MLIRERIIIEMISMEEDGITKTKVLSDSVVSEINTKNIPQGIVGRIIMLLMNNINLFRQPSLLHQLFPDLVIKEVRPKAQTSPK